MEPEVQQVQCPVPVTLLPGGLIWKMFYCVESWAIADLDIIYGCSQGRAVHYITIHATETPLLEDCVPVTMDLE